MLKKERNFYASIKPTLLEHHKGKYALIHGEELIGTFDTDRQAYEEGVKRFGTDEFLTRPITTEEDQIVKYPALTLSLSLLRDGR